MNVKPTDIISGSQYLRMISDYKKYDQRQKDLIYKLQQKIDLLEWSIDGLKNEIEDLEDGSTSKLREKIQNQRLVLFSYVNVIKRQKQVIEELTAANQALQEEVKNLKGDLQNEEYPDIKSAGKEDK